jgi:hypothetical protein
MGAGTPDTDAPIRARFGSLSLVSVSLSRGNGYGCYNDGSDTKGAAKGCQLGVDSGTLGWVHYLPPRIVASYSRASFIRSNPH